jgi:hypothetical protein
MNKEDRNAVREKGRNEIHTNQINDSETTNDALVVRSCDRRTSKRHHEDVGVMVTWCPNLEGLINLLVTRSGLGTVLQDGRSRVRDPIK